MILAALRPELFGPVIIAGSPGALRLLLCERPEAAPLRQTLRQGRGNIGATPNRVVLAIGPEGGWTDAELGAAQRAGWLSASLGNLILRPETAALAALAAINYELGA